MYKQLVLIAMLFSVPAHSQESGSTAPTISEPNTITIQNRTSISYTPDEIEINITLQEYVKTDPESQQTNTIRIEELEKLLLDKLKPFNLKKSDLLLSNLSDMAQTQNGIYNPQQLYTNTQKRLLKKTLALTWKKPIEDLQSFMESMRFTGVQSIYINSSVSDKLKKELNEQLMDKVMKETQEQAQILSNISRKSLGEIVSVNIDPIGIGTFASETAIYPYYNNYNNFYGSNNAQLSKTNISMTALVVFELKEN